MRGRALVPWIALAIALAVHAPVAAQGSAADSAWGRGDRARAEQLYRARLAADSADGTALFRLALLAGWQGRRHESIALLDRLLAHWPRDNDARAARARMLVALGRFDEAVATVDTILELNPADLGGLQLRARFTGFEGDLIESERLWRDVLDREPGNVETRIGLASLLRQQGRADSAEAVLATVRGSATSNTDLREELDRIAAVVGPRIRSRVISEGDSDDNRVATFTLQAILPAAPRFRLNADTWLRAARLGPATGDVTARAGALSARMLVEPGWTFQAGAGVATTDRTDIGAATTWLVSAGTPRQHRWSATITGSRDAFYYTAPMAANGITAEQVQVGVGGRAARRWSVEASAALGRFESARSGVRNRRAAGRASLTRTLPAGVSLSLQASGFGFARDVNDGYFDPDLYGIAAVEVQYRRAFRHASLLVALAPGLQQIGSDGSPGGALHATATFEIVKSPGRSAGFGLVWANTGAQQLSARPAGAYRYASIGLDFRWRFR
ncbi:MAG: tetratricopeptide repeat protein [Gemmatimonadota bacterium]|jgi:tetratricopeptide (TPR) repeat protein